MPRRNPDAAASRRSERSSAGGPGSSRAAGSGSRSSPTGPRIPSSSPGARPRSSGPCPRTWPSTRGLGSRAPAGGSDIRAIRALKHEIDLDGVGFLVLFADGSVRHLPPTVADHVFRALITRNSGEVIAADALEPIVNGPQAPRPGMMMGMMGGQMMTPPPGGAPRLAEAQREGGPFAREFPAERLRPADRRVGEEDGAAPPGDGGDPQGAETDPARGARRAGFREPEPDSDPDSGPETVREIGP